MSDNMIDKHVGGRIRERRQAMRVSQEKLADALGVTFQQVQKYESGANRVSASRLYNIAKILSVPTSFFFAGYGDEGLRVAEPNTTEGSIMSSPETLELVRAYYAIEDASVRRNIFDMVKNLAEPGGGARLKKG